MSSGTTSFDRQQQIESILRAALQHAPHERAAFIAEACEGDLALQREVEARLAAPSHTDSLTNAPTIEALTVEAPTGALTDAVTVGLSQDEQAELFRLTNIGPYKILRKIGEGGMGTVYLAARDDAQYKKQVAIKLVKRGMASSFIIRRFRNERQILASLDHANIARLLDGGTTADGLPYVVMEYVEGKPINEYADERDLSTVERLKLFRQVCAAVHYAHQKLVVHRDIKPSNILVTGEGEPKLVDFGIAKLLDPQPSEGFIDTGATAVGMMTPEYASPEQVRGLPVTIATDVYSLGVVLYQLLTGRRPYQIKSRSPQEIVQAICEQEPLRPSTAVTRAPGALSTDGRSPAPPETRAEGKQRYSNPEKLRRRLRGDLDNIVLMAMRKETERRYASVEQFSSDIQRHLDGLPVIARTDTFAYRASKFLSRHKAGVAAALLIFILLVGGLFAINRQRARAERRFNDVRRLANSFMFEIHDRIESLPGATPVRELLVKRALEYLDSLASEAAGDAGLQRELAKAYQKVGDVQGYPFEANLGDTAGALDSYKKALAISEALVKDHPNDVDMQRDLLVSYERIGDVLLATGDTAGALDHQRKALGFSQAIAAARPDDGEFRRTLMISYLKVGQVLAQTGDTTAALENFRQSLQLAEKSVEADPSSARARGDLALMLNKVGEMLMAGDDATAALEHYRRGLAIREVVAAEDPANATARRAVAASNEKVADVLASMGNVTEALAYQRQTLASDEALAAADPANIDAQFDLGIGYSNIAELFARSGDRRAALEHYRKGLAILERISSDNPDNAEMKSYLADSLIKIGKVLAATGDAKAVDHVNKGRMILEALSSADAANTELRTALADAYAASGDVQAKLAASRQSVDHWRAARSWYGQSLEVYNDLRNRNLLQASSTGKLDELARKVAECDTALAGRGD